MWAYKRFLKYAEVWTTSARGSQTVPSSFRQFDLAHLLVFELKQMGIADAEVDKYGIVYGRIPATPGREDRPCIGFLAHLDTFPDICGEGVRPQVIENYDGDDVPLGNSGRFLKVSEYPHLRRMRGDTLITTDGTTLLGADDKAGIAEIMSALEFVLSKEIPHGPLSVAFVPDEEIGCGSDHFDLERFGARFAYTVDGCDAGEIVYENFNAACVTVRIHGKEVHTGWAKGRLLNAQLVGIEFNGLLPAEEVPSMTEGWQGFYHLRRSCGDVKEAELVYSVRDHDDERFLARLRRLEELGHRMNEKYGEGTASVTIKEEYRNMKGRILPFFHLVESAAKACEMAGVVPKICPTRGGTVGSRLSFMGLPCPILGIGGYAYHGPEEHITAENMESVMRILVGIIRIYSDRKN